MTMKTYKIRPTSESRAVGVLARQLLLPGTRYRRHQGARPIISAPPTLLPFCGFSRCHSEAKPRNLDPCTCTFAMLLDPSRSRDDKGGHYRALVISSFSSRDQRIASLCCGSAISVNLPEIIRILPSRSITVALLFITLTQIFNRRGHVGWQSRSLVISLSRLKNLSMRRRASNS
jgi:hypothetical protein